jgi:hypothetical protein
MNMSDADALNAFNNGMSFISDSLLAPNNATTSTTTYSDLIGANKRVILMGDLTDGMGFLIGTKYGNLMNPSIIAKADYDGSTNNYDKVRDANLISLKKHTVFYNNTELWLLQSVNGLNYPCTVVGDSQIIPHEIFAGQDNAWQLNLNVIMMNFNGFQGLVDACIWLNNNRWIS